MLIFCLVENIISISLKKANTFLFHRDMQSNLLKILISILMRSLLRKEIGKFLKLKLEEKIRRKMKINLINRNQFLKTLEMIQKIFLEKCLNLTSITQKSIG